MWLDEEEMNNCVNEVRAGDDRLVSKNKAVAIVATEILEGFVKRGWSSVVEGDTRQAIVHTALQRLIDVAKSKARHDEERNDENPQEAE